MRVRLFLFLVILATAAFVLAQQSAHQPMAMPQSGGQPIGQPTSTPQTSTQQPITMSQPSGQEPIIKTAEQNVFKTSPGLPDCYTSMIERGDPKTGPYAAYAKLASGCTLPWHWHTFGEQMMFVSGTGQVQAKEQQIQSVSQGSFVYMPAHHQHQTTCPKGCTLYFTRDGAADIHYVDAVGNEISPETALAAVGERPAAAVAAQQ